VIGIYKITNPKGKIYIGQSINVKYRFDTYRRLGKDVSNSPKLYRSLLKYGYVNHKFELIEECYIELLNDRERFYQDLYNVVSDGLNCILTKTNTKSGKGNPISEKQKKQISKVHKGKILSEETKEKIKIARSKQVITEEHKRKISENSGSARIVLDLNTGVFYNSAKELAVLYGLKPNSVVCKLIGKIKNNTSFIYV
jgi:group I intron endonuclease